MTHIKYILFLHQLPRGVQNSQDQQFSTLGSQDAFPLLQYIEDAKDLGFLWVIATDIYTMLEIKTSIYFKSFQNNKSLYVSINLFYEKVTIFLRMKTWEEGAPFYIFASLLSCLTKDSWIFIYTSIFNVWWYVFGSSTWRKSGLTQICCRKKAEHFNGLSR